MSTRVLTFTDCQDSHEMTAAVSSGGAIMKAPGRVAQSAVPGAGIWCEKREGREVRESKSVLRGDQ